MIPKIIHYIWLSGEEMPELNRRCVQSWQRVLGDYEIREWTAADLELERYPYALQAVREKKWAFAADCLRTEILLREGGVYLDSDVYLYGDLDRFLENRFFSFIEYHHDSTRAALQAACMGAESGHPFLKACAGYYRNRSFLDPDGSPDTKTLAPDIFADIAGRFGFDTDDPREQRLDCGMRIYDRSAFAGTPWEIQPGCAAVHLCAGSWRDTDPSLQRVLAALKLSMTEGAERP